ALPIFARGDKIGISRIASRPGRQSIYHRPWWQIDLGSRFLRLRRFVLKYECPIYRCGQSVRMDGTGHRRARQAQSFDGISDYVTTEIVIGHGGQVGVIELAEAVGFAGKSKVQIML